jgi:hypothetical protein
MCRLPTCTYVAAGWQPAVTHAPTWPPAPSRRW